jgi:hypothetical protein
MRLVEDCKKKQKLLFITSQFSWIRRDKNNTKPKVKVRILIKLKQTK